jgi:8-oxo-dGTP diphosphatase
VAEARHQLFQVGQKAFIERDGEVLVLFVASGLFDFPGGRIDEGETDLVEALKREVREETGLEIDVGRPFATWLSTGSPIYLVGYRCRYVSGEVTLSSEHVAFRWVNGASFEEVDDGSAPFEALRRYFEGDAS